MIPVPNLSVPFLDNNGNLNSAWQSFFQQFTQAPPGVNTPVVTTSPFTYTAREPGQLAVSGGAITSIALIRGSVSINVTGEKLIALSVRDSVEIVYTILPSVQFLPNYGSR